MNGAAVLMPQTALQVTVGSLEIFPVLQVHL